MKNTQPKKIVIGDKLKKARQRQKKTLYRVRKDTGIADHVVKSMERGDKQYTIDNLIAYSEYLNERIIND